IKTIGTMRANCTPWDVWQLDYKSGALPMTVLVQLLRMASLCTTLSPFHSGVASPEREDDHGIIQLRAITLIKNHVSWNSKLAQILLIPKRYANEASQALVDIIFTYFFAPHALAQYVEWLYAAIQSFGRVPPSTRNTVIAC